MPPFDVDSYGPHPLEDAGFETFDNTAYFVAALAAGDVSISRAGTYLVSSAISLANGKTVAGAAGVTLKKRVTYSHVFVNSSVAGPINNTGITLRDLTIDNNNFGSGGAASPTSRGILNFHFVDGLTLDNISIINGDNNTFGVHLQEVQNANITDFSYVGDKAGCQMQGGCSATLIDGFDITSHDDPFAINAEDYPANQYSARDCSNITIRNGTSRPHAGQAGYFLRLETGSWLDWASGNTYKIGHCCVNAGKVYKKVNANDQIAANAPTHASGDATGADGITWRKLYSPDVIYSSNISNVTVHNVTLLDERIIYRYVSLDTFDHSQYPGTDGGLLDELHTSLPATAFTNGGGVLGDTYFDEEP